MAKRIRVDGVIHSFPDDATDAEINAALAVKAPAGQVAKPEEPGLLRKAWGAINTPVADLIGHPGDTARGLVDYALGPGTSNQLDIVKQTGPTLKDSEHSMLYGMAKGLAGATQDSGDTAAGFTSPASIALMGAGPVAKALPRIAPVVKGVQALAGSIYGAQGAKQIGEGLGDMSQHNLTPDNSRAVLQGGSQLAGGAAGGIEPVYGASPKLGGAVNNRVLGTSKRGFSFDRDPGLTVAKEGIVGNSQEGLKSNIKERIGDLEGEKQQALIASPRRFDARPMIGAPVRAALDEAQAASNPELYNSLGKIKSELTGKFEPSAMDIKTREPIGPLVRVGDKNLSDVSASALNKLKKDVGERTNWQQFGIPYKKPLNSLKTEMYSGIDKTLDSSVPRYKDINDSQSGLISAADDLGAKMVRDRKKSIFGLGDAYKTALGAGAGMLTHDPMTALGAATLSYAVPRIIGSPAVSTRIARTLANPSGLEEGVSLIPASVSSARSGPAIAPSAKTEKRKNEDER